MHNKPIFYDSDVLICFLEINEQNILKKLFSKVIVPELVYQELNRENSPKNVKNSLKSLMNIGFVEISKSIMLLLK
jgi:predicted nucleic acid-binding protein